MLTEIPPVLVLAAAVIGLVLGGIAGALMPRKCRTCENLGDDIMAIADAVTEHPEDEPALTDDDRAYLAQLAAAADVPEFAREAGREVADNLRRAAGGLRDTELCRATLVLLAMFSASMCVAPDDPLRGITACCDVIGSAAIDLAAADLADPTAVQR